MGKTEIVEKYLSDLGKAVQRAQMENMSGLYDEAYVAGQQATADGQPLPVPQMPEDVTPYDQADIDEAVNLAVVSMKEELQALYLTKAKEERILKSVQAALQGLLAQFPGPQTDAPPQNPTPTPEPTPVPDVPAPPVETPAPTDEVKEQPAPPADIPADVPADVPAETPAETPSDVPADAPVVTEEPKDQAPIPEETAPATDVPAEGEVSEEPAADVETPAVDEENKEQPQS